MKNRNGQNAARPVDFAQDKLEERPGRVSKDGGLLRWYLGVAGSVGVALGSCAAVALHAAVSQVVPHWNVHGWPSFGISVVAVLLNLVAATVLRVLDRRLEPGWFLVHGGLALAIAGALGGALFATRGKIVVHEGDGTDLVVDASGRPVAELPFRIVLSDFRLETGIPSLALVDTEETRMLMRKGDPIHELREGAKGELRGIRFEVLRYLPLAELDHDTVRASSDSTAPPAALLRYRDRRDGIWRQGWITCGGTGIPTLTRPAVEARLAMSSPPPRAFRSEVTVVERGGKPRQEAIEVNRGIDVAGWTLQQLDYDRRAGKASSFSILDLGEGGDLDRGRGHRVVRRGDVEEVGVIWNWFPALAAVHLSLSAAGAALAATRWRKLSPVLLGGAAVLLSGFLAAVWIDMERPPLRTYGETRLVYAAGAGILSVALWVGVRQVWTLLFGAVVSALFVALTLALPESHTRELLPALRSPWFVPHVVVYLFGYAVSTAASLAAFLDSRRPIPNGRKLDTTLSVSVVFLTWGLLFGALWAKEAWGSYWTWDPKETWAFLTWAGYMGVLHWRRARPQDPLAGTRFLAAWWIVLMLAWFAVASLPAGADSIHTYAQ